MSESLDSRGRDCVNEYKYKYDVIVCCESLWKQFECFFGGHLVSVIGRPVVEETIIDAGGCLRQLRAAVHLVGAHVSPAFA